MQTEIAEDFNTFATEEHQYHAGGQFASVMPKEHNERDQIVVNVELFAKSDEELPFEFLQMVDEHDMDVKVTEETLELNDMMFDKVELEKVI
jgi:hypothetical protein